MNTSSLMLSTSFLLASSSTLALHAQGGSLGALEADRFGCEADRSHQGSETNDHMGFDMDAGDWNGDGIDDLLVAGAPGSPYDPSNRTFECPEAPPPAPLIKGRAFIFAGTDPDDWATEPPFSLWAALEGDEEGDRFGWEVAGVGRLGDEPVVGDPTGPDEHDDVVIGAPESANINKLSFNHLGGGYAHLCFGRDDPYWDDTLPPGMQAPVPVVLVDPQVHTPGSGDPWMFGHSIAGGSDLDQDGSADFLVGDPFYSANGNEQGAVYAYSWDRASASVVPTFIGLVPITLSLDEPDPNGAFQDGSAHLGWDVEMFDQVAFGGQYDALFLDPGAPEFLVGALTNGQDLVPVMACAGELQGGRTNGRAFVLSIVVPDLPDLPFVAVQAVYFGEELRARLGSSVATGDFDGDGRPDVATGSTGYTGSSVETEIGQVHIFKNLATEP